MAQPEIEPDHFPPHHIGAHCVRFARNGCLARGASAGRQAHPVADVAREGDGLLASAPVPHCLLPLPHLQQPSYATDKIGCDTGC